MGLNRDRVVKIGWLNGNKNFVCKRQKFIWNTFINLKPWRFERMGVI